MILRGASSVRDVLYGGGPEPPLDVDLQGALSHLSPGQDAGRAADAVRQDVSEAAMGLLEIDLADVLVAGWTRHSALRAAGRRTKHAPGTFETVQLSEHRIAYEAQPCVDVSLRGVRLARVQLTVEVTVDLTGLGGSVSDGRLTSLFSGDARVEAALAVQGTPVVHRGRQLDLRAELDLGEGLRLA